jgi:hypothetical protein
MKTIPRLLAFTLFFLLPTGFTFAQNPVRARTETGKDVLLYPDGTWKNAPDVPASSHNSTFSKPATARMSYKPSRGDFTIWYDPTKWRLQQDRTGDDKGHFSLIGTDGYAMVIAEGLAIPSESLKQIALQNAQDAASDARIVSEEKRIVNGTEVICLVIEGTIQQIPFTYYGYYYGGKQGTIQMLTFTGQNLFAKYKPDFTEFLNGLEIKN